MRSDKTIDLVKERQVLEKADRVLVDSYKAFVHSFSQYRRLEERLKPSEEEAAPGGRHLSRPAAVSGRNDD